MTTELTTAQNFALAIENPEALDVITETLASEEFTSADLDRISVPAGGATQWEVNTAEGEKTVPEIRGIIVLASKGRTYWEKPFGGETTPPDCISYDCKTGVGNPGGDCATCPFAQYGSAKMGGGKACREKRTLFLLQEGELFPSVLNVPPSSLKPLKSYMMRLAKSGVAISGCVTSFTLSKEVSKANIKYSQINFAMAERLTPERRTAVQEYMKAFGGAMETAHRTEVRGDAEPREFDDPFNV